MDAFSFSSRDGDVPYTLLGFLLRGGDRRSFDFSRDYFRRATNAFLWILLVSSTSFLVQRLARIFKLWALGVRIPGPSFFVGCSVADPPLCGSGANINLTGYLSKLHENYGPIVRLFFSPSQLFVSIKDKTLIKEILIKANDKLPLTQRAYNLAFGTLNLFISSFDNVKETRESLAKYLNNKSISKTLIETLIQKTDSIVTKGVTDCKYLSQYMAFNVLGATIFGENFIYWDKINQYEELLMKVAKDGFFWANYIIPPIWKIEYWRYKSLCKKLKQLTLEIVEMSSNNYKINFEELGYNNYSKDEACGNILGIMLHGCVTSANLIENILTRLVLYPDLHEKIYCEINEVNKSSLNDVTKMRFLLATIFESVRLLPAGPFLQRCSLNSDVRLENGTTIPAGAIVVVPLHLVQTDVSIWGDNPLQFNPLHFLSSDSNLKEACKKRECLFSFGYGTRACVGQNFAILSIATIIASLIYSYEIKLHQDNSISHEILCPKIVIKKRNMVENI